MAQKRESKKLSKPAPLSRADRIELSRILKKARAFKAYYQAKGSVTGKRP